MEEEEHRPIREARLDDVDETLLTSALHCCTTAARAAVHAWLVALLPLVGCYVEGRGNSGCGGGFSARSRGGRATMRLLGRRATQARQR
jgi:hypothetical protein